MDSIEDYFNLTESDYPLESFDSNFTNITNATNSSICKHDFGPDVETRFWLVGVAMLSVCVVGTIGNFCIVIVLTRKNMQTSNSWFLVTLALFDSGVMLATILLYCVEVLYDYTRNFLLYVTWFHYVRVIYVLSHIFQVSSCYLTIAATVERFISLWSRSQSHACCVKRSTVAWIFGILAFVVLLNGSKYFELMVLFEPECHEFGRYGLTASVLLLNDNYKLVHSLWISNIFFVFFPFISLALLNILIWQMMKWRATMVDATLSRYLIDCSSIADVVKVRSDSETASSLRRTVGDTPRSLARKAKRRNREATIVLFVVVLVFLLCNAPQFTLTLAEQIEMNFLQKHPELYSFARDGINFLTVINSSTNFLIYMIFGREFRKELFKTIRRPSAYADIIGVIKMPLNHIGATPRRMSTRARKTRLNNGSVGSNGYLHKKDSADSESVTRSADSPMRYNLLPLAQTPTDRPYSRRSSSKVRFDLHDETEEDETSLSSCPMLSSKLGSVSHAAKSCPIPSPPSPEYTETTELVLKPQLVLNERLAVIKIFNGSEVKCYYLNTNESVTI